MKKVIVCVVAALTILMSGCAEDRAKAAQVEPEYSMGNLALEEDHPVQTGRLYETIQPRGFRDEIGK
jgi:hypothetical protein